MALGAKELALDTAEWTYHLMSMYPAGGYRLVDDLQWETTNYRSVILSKNLHLGRTPNGEIEEFLRDLPQVNTPAERTELKKAVLATSSKKEHARILSRLGDVYRTQRNICKALHCFEKATDICVQTGNQPLLLITRPRPSRSFVFDPRGDPGCERTKKSESVPMIPKISTFATVNDKTLIL